MGADLYIKSITEPARAKYEPLFNKAVAVRDGFMRDRQGYEAFVATYEKIGVDLPSIRKQVKMAKAKIEVLKAKVEEAQKEVSRYFDLMYGRGGYFRDSYNGSSVLWRLGLSWWNDAPSGIVRSATKLAEFAKRVENAKFQPITAEELKERGCKVDDGQNSPAAWNKMFRNKKRRLVRFLKRAACHAALGHEIYFSV